MVWVMEGYKEFVGISFLHLSMIQNGERLTFGKINSMLMSFSPLLTCPCSTPKRPRWLNCGCTLEDRCLHLELHLGFYDY